MTNRVIARHFELWLNDNKSRYANLARSQILADEDGMYGRPLSDVELKSYYLAHNDYLNLMIKNAKHGCTNALNELWDLVKRGGLSSDTYYDVKKYYNGEKEIGTTDVDNACMGDL